jgi:hypothetical protein
VLKVLLVIPEVNYETLFKYRVILKSRRDFRPLRYSSRDGHAEGEHVNRGRDTLSFCPTLQVLDMSTLDDVADVNPVTKFLPHTLQHLAVDSSVHTCPLFHVIYAVPTQSRSRQVAVRSQ